MKIYEFVNNYVLKEVFFLFIGDNDRFYFKFYLVVFCIFLS